VGYINKIADVDVESFMRCKINEMKLSGGMPNSIDQDNMGVSKQRDMKTALSRNAIVFFFFYYSYVHTRLGSFLPPAPTPSLTTHSAPSSPPPPQYPAETILPLFLILL
jgi:hypothetical protein